MGFLVFMTFSPCFLATCSNISFNNLKIRNKHLLILFLPYYLCNCTFFSYLKLSFLSLSNFVNPSEPMLSRVMSTSIVELAEARPIF